MSQTLKSHYLQYDPEVRPFGFANSQAFTRALDDWMEAHLWSLQTCTQAFVLSAGGVEFLQLPPLYMMSFEVVCHMTPEWTTKERNPTHIFTIQQEGFMKISDWKNSHPTHVQFWEDAAPAEDGLLSMLMQEHHGSAFACLMCTQFNCDGVTLANTKNFPILHVRKPLPLDEPSLDIVHDVYSLCLDMITWGFALRTIEGGDAKTPVPGRYTRRDRKWVWAPLFTDWDEYSPTSNEYRDLHMALSRQRKTHLSPKQLLNALQAL